MNIVIKGVDGRMGSANQKIRFLMKENNVTLKDMSLKTDINPLKLVSVLLNPFHKIKMTQGIAIAKVFNVKVADLF